MKKLIILIVLLILSSCTNTVKVDEEINTEAHYEFLISEKPPQEINNDQVFLTVINQRQKNENAILDFEIQNNTSDDITFGWMDIVLQKQVDNQWLSQAFRAVVPAEGLIVESKATESFEYILSSQLIGLNLESLEAEYKGSYRLVIIVNSDRSLVSNEFTL